MFFNDKKYLQENFTRLFNHADFKIKIGLITFEKLIIVLSILFSKSLYFESLGYNSLLIGFFFLLVIYAYFYNRSYKIEISKRLIIFTYLIFVVILINPEFVPSTVAAFVARAIIALLFVSVISFESYALVFFRLLKFLIILSIPFFLVIYFDIPSCFPSFNTIVDYKVRNFLFFGVQEFFISDQIFRNSGLWWEPGAFQLFINLGFVFGLIYKKINIKNYLIFLIGILSTVSTTGVLVFLMLSIIYFKSLRLKTKFIYILFVIPVCLVIFVNIGLDKSFFKKFDNNTHEYASTLSRFTDVAIDWEILKDYPLMGSGFGNLEVRDQYISKRVNPFIMMTAARPTGADGILLFIANLGLLSFVILIPFLFPKYLIGFSLFEKFLFFLAIIGMFITENFSFVLIFNILLLYGVIGSKSKFDKII